MSSRLAPLAWIAAVAAVAMIGAPAHGQATDPTVVFESPQENGYASGPMPIRIRLEPPAAPVRSITILADGRVVCTLERPPWECPWDAGSKVVEHALRATVLLADGRRIPRTIRTKAVEYAETVDVDVVQVTATVTDGKGQFVRGLPREAFRVYEDGVLQKISSFSAENIPLEIIVAVDTSASMTSSMDVVREGVKHFLSALRPEDSVTLLSFNDNIFALARPGADLATRVAAVDGMLPWGGTALYDVIVKSIDQLTRQKGRRALVIFTDGEDVNSRVSEQAADLRVEASDVVVYSIGLGRAMGTEPLRRVLERLSVKSGGRAFFEDLAKLDDVFARIIEELANQYLIGYPRPDTAADNRWRKIKVELPDRDVKVRARQGYRVAAK